MVLWFRPEQAKIQIIYRTYQVLAPLMLKVPLDALYLALVSILLGSLPWLGSVKPKQPKISPLAAGQITWRKTFLINKTYIKIFELYKIKKRALTKSGQVLLFLGICAIGIDWVHDQR